MDGQGTGMHESAADGKGSAASASKAATSRAGNSAPMTVKTASHIKCITTASHITGGQVLRQDVGELDVTSLARERRAQRLADKADGGGDGPGPCSPLTVLPAPCTLVLCGCGGVRACVRVFGGREGREDDLGVWHHGCVYQASGPNLW